MEYRLYRLDVAGGINEAEVIVASGDQIIAKLHNGLVARGWEAWELWQGSRVLARHFDKQPEAASSPSASSASSPGVSAPVPGSPVTILSKARTSLHRSPRPARARSR